MPSKEKFSANIFYTSNLNRAAASRAANLVYVTTSSTSKAWARRTDGHAYVLIRTRNLTPPSLLSLSLLYGFRRQRAFFTACEREIGVSSLTLASGSTSLSPSSLSLSLGDREHERVSASSIDGLTRTHGTHTRSLHLIIQRARERERDGAGSVD